MKFPGIYDYILVMFWFPEGLWPLTFKDQMQGALFVKQPIMLCNLVLLLHYIIYRTSYTVTIKVKKPPLKKDPSDLSVSTCLVEVCARREFPYFPMK